MPDLGPRDRQDLPIWNAIEANNFKQALKLVDKRLAKKPSDYLEALKIYIRSRSPLVTEKSAVLIHIEELTGRKPPITDLEAIELYDEALEEVLPEKSSSSWGKSIGELRWQLAKALPKDEETVLKCFQECLSNGDLDHARQISNSLEKTFAGNHAYIFWNISTMFLYSISQSCPENQKKIWGGLAFGQITKLALTTRQSTDTKKLPLRAIHNPQELLLLHRITKAYGKPEQRLEYLNDDQLGPDSVIAKGEWELWRFRLKLMEESTQWQELFDTSKALLRRARTKDASGKITEPGMSDWIVWEAFIRSAVELPGHRQKPEVLAELEAHLDPESGIDKTWRRNASLAWVKFCFDAPTPFSVIPGTNGKGQVLNHIPIVFKYLQKFGDASTAYKDLRPYVERLDAEERSQLLSVLLKSDIFETAANKEKSSDGVTNLGPLGEDLSSPKNITHSINVYKLRHLLVSALPEHERRQSPTYRTGVNAVQCAYCKVSCKIFCQGCLKGLALDSIRSYKAAINDDGKITKTLLITDTHPADDFCIIAAMCLIKLGMVNQENGSEPLRKSKTTYTIQAILLLEHCWTRSKPNFQLSLLLVRLYNYTGLGSLAMRAYLRLSLKQVQLDTLSYTIFDRISSQHPHNFEHDPDGSSPGKTILEHFQKQQKVYRNARGQISKNMWSCFQKGNYNSVFEMKEVSDTLSRTLSGVMSVVESRKVTRIIEPAVALTSIFGGYDILQPNPEHPATSFVDTNDYSTFPNFELCQGARFEILSRFAPGPSEYRYRQNLFAERLKQIIIAPAAMQQDGENHEQHLWLREYVDSKRELDESHGGDLTKSEELAYQLFDDIAVILREACDKERWADEKFQDLLSSRNAFLHRTLDDNARLVNNMAHVVPAFWDTLHSLYTAHEVAKAALDFCDYTVKQGKNIHEQQKEATKELAESAQRLLTAVLDKAKAAKKGIEDGGWIDKVLECGLPDAGEAQATADAVRELVDENFLEEWAGLAVESWGDSVVGLGLLKPV